MTGVPSMAQIRAQVASIRKGYPDARAIGIGLPALDEAATATAALRIDAEELPVVRCRSVLALREHLVDLPAAGPPLVVLTDLPPAELGEDLRARLAHRKLFSIDAWQLVKERFKAHYVDPRLVERHEWAGPALLDAEPEAGYPPAPSGFLDAETAWRGLFEGLMGIPRGERDPETLLVWALADEPVQRLAALPQAVRDGLVAAAGDSAGRAARAILACAGRLGRRAVSIGLVARVLFDTDGRANERAARARGKLEALLELHDLDAALARAWTAAAERVVRRQLARSAEPGEPDSQGTVEEVLADADDLLRTLGAEDLAGRSEILRASLEQRLTGLARELTAFVGGTAHDLPDTLRGAADRVLDHALSAGEPRRTAGVEMALRLAGWLAVQRRNGQAGSRRRFGEAARSYGREGAFVDRARARLWDGDPSPVVAAAYGALAERADEAREQKTGNSAGSWRTGRARIPMSGARSASRRCSTGASRRSPACNRCWCWSSMR